MVTSSGSGPSARTRGSRTCHPAGCGPTHGPSARGGQQVFVDLNTTPGSSAAQRGSSFSQKHTPSIGLSALCGVSPLASPPRASGCAVHPQRAEGIAEHFDQTIAEGSIRTRGGDRDGRRHLHDLRAIRVGDGAASFVHTPASYHHVGSSAHARPWTASGCLASALRFIRRPAGSDCARRKRAWPDVRNIRARGNDTDGSVQFPTRVGPSTRVGCDKNMSPRCSDFGNRFTWSDRRDAKSDLFCAAQGRRCVGPCALSRCDHRRIRTRLGRRPCDSQS